MMVCCDLRFGGSLSIFENGDDRIMKPYDDCIEQMVQRLVARFNPVAIILFGSWARGEAGPDSDVDLLLVMDVVGSKRKITVEACRTLQAMGLAKDVVVVRPEEVDRYRDVVGSLIYPALREGEVLYERAA